ncbi:unnamed protein product, partial [Rotaria magnacalcarata]
MAREQQFSSNPPIQQPSKLCPPTTFATPATSSINDIQIFFDNDTLAQHQNAAPEIQRIKKSRRLH